MSHIGLVLALWDHHPMDKASAAKHIRPSLAHRHIMAALAGAGIAGTIINSRATKAKKAASPRPAASLSPAGSPGPAK